MSDKIKSMIGKLVTNIEVTEGEGTIIFHHENGDRTEFYATGDCCSESWIEHFENVSRPEKIVDFVEHNICPYPDEIPETKTDHYEESMQYYFYKLITDRGEYNVEMRNSSNGYYGGALE